MSANDGTAQVMSCLCEMNKDKMGNVHCALATCSSQSFQNSAPNQCQCRCQRQCRANAPLRSIIETCGNGDLTGLQNMLGSDRDNLHQKNAPKSPTQTCECGVAGFPGSLWPLKLGCTALGCGAEGWKGERTTMCGATAHAMTAGASNCLCSCRVFLQLRNTTTTTK